MIKDEFTRSSPPDCHPRSPILSAPETCHHSPAFAHFEVARAPVANYTTPVIRILSLRLIALALLLSRAMVGA
jgi:hypothetical protein